MPYIYELTDKIINAPQLSDELQAASIDTAIGVGRTNRRRNAETGQIEKSSYFVYVRFTEEPSDSVKTSVTNLVAAHSADAVVEIDHQALKAQAKAKLVNLGLTADEASELL